MAETAEKRKVIRRPPEERIAEIDAKIKSHKEAIQKLEEKKNSILNPKPRTSKAAKTKLLIAKAKEAGLTEEEIDALLEKAISKKAAQAEE
ncbi:hypothetical protein [Flintibacter muris]|uniref:hypothetical protein n=1 Tax=Flintibacter muris TaxID=2941327 RepID=UPI00203A6E4B|nr:hypothetical protein [Flintibacter muris]